MHAAGMYCLYSFTGHQRRTMHVLTRNVWPASFVLKGVNQSKQSISPQCRAAVPQVLAQGPFV